MAPAAMSKISFEHLGRHFNHGRSEQNGESENEREVVHARPEQVAKSNVAIATQRGEQRGH